MTTVEMLTSFDGIESEWDALVDRVGGGPFMRPGWLATYWRTRAEATPLRIVTVRDGGRLVALAPFHVVGRKLASLGHSAQTPFEPPVEPGYVGALAAALLQQSVHRMTMTYLPQTSPLLPALTTAVDGTGWRAQVRAYERTVEIGLGGATLSERVPRKLRRELQRRERRLAELGEVTVTVHDGSDGLDEHLDELIAVEASGWKGPSGTGTAIACSSHSRAFFREWTAWAAERGWLRLSFLRLDGRPIAARVGLEAGGVRYGIRTGYDERYATFSPANLLVYRTLQQLSDSGFERFVFLGRDEPHKTRWSDEGTEHVLVHLFAPTPVGRAQWLAYAYVRPLVVAVRQWRASRRAGAPDRVRVTPRTAASAVLPPQHAPYPDDAQRRLHLPADATASSAGGADAGS